MCVTKKSNVMDGEKESGMNGARARHDGVSQSISVCGISALSIFDRHNVALA